MTKKTARRLFTLPTRMTTTRACNNHMQNTVEKVEEYSDIQVKKICKTCIDN